MAADWGPIETRQDIEAAGETSSIVVQTEQRPHDCEYPISCTCHHRGVGLVPPCSICHHRRRVHTGHRVCRVDACVCRTYIPAGE